MEPQLNDDLYMRFRALLISRSGLFYPQHKRDDLEHGLSLALKATGLKTLAELFSDAVNNGPSWEVVLTHLTIGETNFFRNKPQFEALQRHIFPEIFERRAALRSIRIWSAGCATGEEPYSIAMLLQKILPDIADWHISILATDINPDFLLRSREGLYGNWSFRDTNEDLKSRFFTQEGNRWRLNESIRNMVTFARLNLIESMYPSITNGTTALDIILCRNVTIYFDEPTTRKVVDRFYRALSPGGWLIVGHSEPQASIYHQFEVHNFPNTVVYRKQMDAPLFAMDQKPLESSTPMPDLDGLLRQLRNASQSFGNVTGQQQNPNDRDQRTVIPSSVSEDLPPSFLPEPEKQEPRPSWQAARKEPVASNRPSTIPSSKQKIPPFSTNRRDNSAPPAATAIASTGNADAGALWAKIKMLLVQGEKTVAEQLLQELLQLRPDHVEARTVLGRLCADRGEWGCAQYHCEAALQADPLHIEAHYTLAQIYEHEGLFDDALSEYRRVVYLDRRFVLGMLGMANVWRQMGRMEEARRNYRNVLKQLANLSPSTPVPGADGATASELAAFATRQLQSLG